MPKHSPRLFGFTLLELLVVISIIGILVAMGAASFSVAQQQGRDARKRGDMKSVQNAMEQFYVAGSTYTGSGCAATAATTLTINSQAFTSPKVSQYTCTMNAAGSPAGAAAGIRYCACALLDKANTGNGGVCADGTVSAGDDYFCVKSLQ